MNPSRAYDTLYDPTFTVSGARDHYRQQTIGGGFMLERAPDFRNFFSELPHHPAHGYRFKNSDKVPGFVDRAYHASEVNPAAAAAISVPEVVAGTQRYKYFRRPLLAAMHPPAGIHQDAPLPLPRVTEAPAMPEPRSKTVATQSDYRESEAQTVPYSPDWVLPNNVTAKQAALSEKHHCMGPEVLALQDMTFGDGLPAGLAEITRIDRMREKRAFEASLPPIDDIARLPLRQAMIEAWEEKEWAARDMEILGVQEERLELLEQAIQAREEEAEAAHTQRIEARKVSQLQERASKFASIHTQRVKTMRHLASERQRVPLASKALPSSIVDKYANFSSAVYAPMAREGRRPEILPTTKPLDMEAFTPHSLQALSDLESTLPARLLTPKVATPKPPAKMNYTQRQAAAVQAELRHVHELLDTAKTVKGRGFGDCWPAPLADKEEQLRASSTRSTRPLAERPLTPVLPVPNQADPRQGAAVLLQRLLRGRAIQNLMYEAKMRRLELIREVEAAPDADEEPLRPEQLSNEAVEAEALIGQALCELWVVCTTGQLPQVPPPVSASFSPLESSRKAPDSISSPTRNTAIPTTSASEPSKEPTDTPHVAEEGSVSSLMHEEAKQPSDVPEDTHAAAIAIQAAMRSRLARQQVEDMKAARAAAAEAQPQLESDAVEDSEPVLSGDELAEANAAASTIQAVMRSKLARQQVEEMRAASSAAHDANSADLPAEPSAEDEAVPGEILPMDMAEANAAAATIQAVMRSKLARQQVEEMRAANTAGREASSAEMPSEPAVQAEAPLSEEDMAEANAAAATIQAVMRSKLARQQVEEMRAASTADPAANSAEMPAEPSVEADADVSDVPQEDLAEANAAAATIQAVMRSKLARQQVDEMRAAAAAAAATTDGAEGEDIASAQKDEAEEFVEPRSADQQSDVQQSDQ